MCPGKIKSHHITLQHSSPGSVHNIYRSVIVECGDEQDRHGEDGFRCFDLFFHSSIPPIQIYVFSGSLRPASDSSRLLLYHNMRNKSTCISPFQRDSCIISDNLSAGQACCSYHGIPASKGLPAYPYRRQSVRLSRALRGL